MSTIKVPNDSEKQMLDAMIAYIGTFNYRLFRNNYTPINTSTESNFTEANFDGYSEQSVSFGAATTNGNGEAQVIASDIVFACNGATTPNTIYGYYVVDGGNNLLWAERFDSSIAITGNGDDITISPKFVLRSIY